MLLNCNEAAGAEKVGGHIIVELKALSNRGLGDERLVGGLFFFNQMPVRS